MTTRTLVVLRHAKAVHTSGLADRERPLTEVGERDALKVGAALAGMDLTPDLVLCSPSVRTRQTADLALPDAEILIEPAIYEAYPDELLTLIRRSDPEVGTLVLVGHNPGVQELVTQLTAADGDDGFPPGAFAVIEVDGDWSGFDTGRGIAHWNPKKH